MHKTKTTSDKTTQSSPKVPPRGAHLPRRPDETLLDELKSRLLEINDLLAASSVLSWDQATYMPRGGAPARSRQGATLHKLAHPQLVDPALGRLLDALASFAERLSPNSDDASLIRVARRDFEKALKVPPDHVARASALGSAAYDAWTRARPANDFATMLPFLEQAVELGREYANFFAPYDHVADPLIDDADEGMTTRSLRDLFQGLREELVPIVRTISDQQKVDDSCLYGSFDEQAQFDFGLRVVSKIGYDLERGRLIGRIIRSAPSFPGATFGLQPASTRAMLCVRSLQRCTRRDTRFMNKA